jgi:hypothetical protein
MSFWSLRSSMIKGNSIVCGSPCADGASIRLSGKNLQVCTVQQLKAMLKEMNLPLKGNKEELIARLIKEQKR